MEFSYDEGLGDGLRYTETRDHPPGNHAPALRRVWADNKKPAVLCQLWADGCDEAVSYLTRFQFKQRFGATALPVEGIGGVATPPTHRRKGYSATLTRKCIERASQQVDALFLFGVKGLYTKYGFSTCSLGSEISLAVRVGEGARPMQGAAVRPMTQDDHGKACDLFNQAHAVRPCSAVREAGTFSGPRRADDWRPGEIGAVLEKDREILGYVIYTADSFGAHQPFAVTELVAAHAEAAEALIREVALLGVRKRLETVTFHAAPDSVPGLVLRKLGCKVLLDHPSDGGGMGLIRNRASLINALGDEFTRRAERADRSALDALASGRIYPDNTILMPLITGYVSWKDVERLGRPVSRGFENVVRKWFPGGGTVELLLPYAHRLDRY